MTITFLRTIIIIKLSYIDLMNQEINKNRFYSNKYLASPHTIRNKTNNKKRKRRSTESQSQKELFKLYTTEIMPKF